MEDVLHMKEAMQPFDHYALWAVLICGVIGVLYALYLRRGVLAAEQGTDEMKRIAKQIQEGANAYLGRQFRTIMMLVVILAIALVFSGVAAGWDIAIGRGLAFLLGCFCSGFTGYIGMTLAVRANVRCANSARTSLAEAMQIAFRSGGVAGMFTVTMGLLGATVIFMLFYERATEVLLGFGFGGCLLALFMRVGGGIYTKAADVGADLVGKVEAGIPEDDPRNAAVIADQVGDNVGDCAGMAADIFESYEVTLVASMILALAHGAVTGNPRDAVIWIMFPLLVRAVGVLTSIFGIHIVRSRTEDEFPMYPITRGFVWSAVLSAVAFFFVANSYANDMRLFWATILGLVMAVAMYKLTEYYTSADYEPVQSVSRASTTGTATNILTGFAEGLESSVFSLLIISGCMFGSIIVFGSDANAVEILYGVSLTGLGMLTTTGVIISMDTYGPIADNAQGIAEMANIEDAAENVEILDAVGNTTKAATKGIAIASAVIAAISLFGSYLSKVAAGQAGAGGGAETVSLEALQRLSIPMDDPKVFIGMLIGGAMPFLFSSMTIRAVSRAAFLVISEVRRQFAEIPGLMEGKEGVMPESGRIVDICTMSALRELIAPALLAILAPVIVGAWMGWPGLGGFLGGIIVTGMLMAVLMCNAGGAWDNGKKLIEDGMYGGKGSEPHKAAVVGDTVGDPFKDTAGPALNPLIKVMNLVGLLIAPVIVGASMGPEKALPGTGLIIAGVILAVVVAIALVMSKRESEEIKKLGEEVEKSSMGEDAEAG
ncbi:MAG: sodium-translocating pyrophosphatase [Armatimonadota bacterium]